ncbi:hypothetical protein ACF3NY_14680 [Barrientosiimonas humi]
MNDAQRPPGRDTDRLDEMLDEDGTGDQDVRYLAPMPTRRPGADTSDDPTAATPIEPRPGGYARPAIDGAARERGRPGAGSRRCWSSRSRWPACSRSSR